MLLIKNGYVKPMVGADIENGCVLIGDNGKIEKVAANIEAPENCQVIDAGGRLVTPGCIDAHCHIGLYDQAINWEGHDYNECYDPITPHIRGIDSIYPQDEAFPNALKGGVTTVCVGPGSANVVGGTFLAMKTYGKRVDKMVVKNPLAMKCAFGENPKNVFGKTSKKAPFTRMGTAALLRELLFKTKRYLADKEAGKNPAFDFKLESMIPVIKGELPLKCHCHRADDILTAVRIGKEFGLKQTLDHVTDGSCIADELGEEGIPCFIGPSFGNKSKVELEHKSFETVNDLYKAGVPVSIITDAPVVPIEHLPMCAGLACDAGLPEEEAWKCITINPAVQTGIGDVVGSLEAGKDGDVVIWTGNPIKELGAKSYVTVVRGEVVYQE